MENDQFDIKLYKFPQSIDGLEFIETLQVLRDKLKYRMCSMTGNKNTHLKKIKAIYTNNQQYIAVNCQHSNCQWRMHYTRCETYQQRSKKNRIKDILMKPQQFKPGFILSKFELYHTHKPLQKDQLGHKNQPNNNHNDINKQIICQALHDVHINPIFIKTIIGSIIKQDQRLFYLKSYNYQQQLKCSNNYTFFQWYLIAKCHQFHVITYPLIASYQSNYLNYIAPDFIIITTSNAKKVYRKKGQLIGIKVITGKVLQKTQQYHQYNQIVFYQYLPNTKKIIYMIAFYPQGNSVIKYLNNVALNKIKENYVDDNQQLNRYQNYNKRKIRVDINLYKVLRIFLQTMGDKVKTFIIQDKQQQIQTMQYFINCINSQSNSNKISKNKISYIVNPSTFIQKQVPKSLQQICRKMLTSHSEKDYNSLYRHQLSKEHTHAERKALTKIHENRHKYVVFSGQSHIFLGGWFKTIEQFTSQIIDSDSTKKRNLVYLLILGCQGLNNQFRQKGIYKNQSGGYRFRNVLQFIKVDSFFQQSFVKQYRLSLYRQGFKEIMKQIFKSYQLNCIYGYNRKIGGKDKCQQLFINNCQSSLQDQLRTPKNQLQILMNDKNIDYENMKIYKMRYNIQQLYKDYGIHANQLNNNNQHNSQFNSDLKSQPFKQLYEKSVSYNYSNFDRRNQSNLEQSDYDIISPFDQLQQPSQKCLKPPIDIRMAHYEQLYPILPVTSIKNQGTLPPFFQFWQNGQTFTCSQKQMETNDKNINNTKIQPKYVCSCCYTNVRGLPCRHILNICLKYKLGIDQYIEDYWRVIETYNEWRELKYFGRGLQLPKVGRPKTSRRNKFNNH